MKSKKLKSSTTYSRMFLIGCFVSVLVSLLVTSLWISYFFSQREAARSVVYQKQVKASLEREYKSISEEAWTQNFESIALRMHHIAESLGTQTDMVLITNEKHDCVFFTAKDPAEDCRNHRHTASFVTYNSIANSTISVQEIPGKIFYRVKLEIGAINLGDLTVVFDDPNNFVLSEGTVKFAVESMLVPVVIIFIIWALWLFYANRRIMRPYVANLLKLQQKAAYAQTARQVSHDIQSPLTAVDRTVRRATFKDPAEQRLLMSAIDRLKEIVSDLSLRSEGKDSNFTATDSYVKSNATFDINLAFIEVVSEKEAENSGKKFIKIKYERCSAAEPLHVCGNAQHLKRAFSNLLNNAIESCGNHVDVTVEFQRQSTGQINISMIDSGCGISPEVLARLGHEEVTAGKKSGHGLGYFWSKKAVEESGGQLTIQSNIGLGTTLTMTFELISSVPDVILVDDNIFIQEVWQTAAEESGRSILIFQSAKEFFAYDLKNLPKSTLFFLDVNLEEEDSGIKIARHLINRSFNRVHLATGHDPKDLTCSYDLSGLAGVIGKDPPDFVSIND